MSKLGWAGVLAAISQTASGGSALAQSITIPGVGRIDVPSAVTELLEGAVAEGRQQNRREPRSRRPLADPTPQPCGSRRWDRFPQDCPIAPPRPPGPARNPDGSFRCNASASDQWSSVRIVSARLGGPPSSITSLQRTVSGEIRAYYVIDYEVEPRVAFPFAWSDGYPEIQDAAGNVWGAMRDRDTDDRSVVRERGTVFRDRVIATLGPDGVVPAEVTLTLGTTMTIPNENVLEQRRRGHEFVFVDMPVECSEPDAAGTPAGNISELASPGSQPRSALIVPRQRDGATFRPTADEESPRFAFQVGYIWTFAEGVPADFEQGLAWLQEAERRQVAQRDYAMQRDTAALIRDYGRTDPLALNQEGQRYGIRNEWSISRFYFTRSAELGDVQGMASLGWVYQYGFSDALAQIYWCRKAYNGARANGFREQEIDTVNYFCPVETFNTLMTPAERRNNLASIARADAKSTAIRRDVEAIASIVEAFRQAASSGPSNSHSTDGHADWVHEQNALRDRAYARREGETPEPGAPF